MRNYSRRSMSLFLLAILLVSGFSAIPALGHLVSPPAASANTGSNIPAGDHAYFGLLAKDGKFSTMLTNDPNLKLYDNYLGSASASENLQTGFNLVMQSSAGSLFEGGIVADIPYSLNTGFVASFEISSTPTHSGEVVLSSVFNQTNYSYKATTIIFRMIDATNEILVNGTVIWSQANEPTGYNGGQIWYSSWAVEIVSGTLMVYIDSGSGFQLLYDNADFNYGFTTGYLYMLGDTQSTTAGTVSFAYLSTWTSNSPVAEGTFDMNMWYLIRHYETITAGTYAGDAVELDTSAPPLWMSLSNGGDMYAGMAVGSSDCVISDCQVSDLVNMSNARTQILDYTFCEGASAFATGSCNYAASQAVLGNILPFVLAYVQVNQTSDQYNTTVYYKVNVTSPAFVWPGGISSYCFYFGNTKIACPTSGTASSTTMTFAEPFGVPGMRYVSRHITEVVGLLLKELGYGASPVDWADPLLNFMNGIYSSCQNQTSFACPKGASYEEYYSPMFPSVVNSSLLLSDWYATAYAFPPSAYYQVQPSGRLDTFVLPGQTVAQWSDPYISRMSLLAPAQDTIGLTGQDLFGVCYNGTAPQTTAQQCWTNDLQTVGYDPTELALRAEYTVNIGGSATTALNLLNQVGWNGVGGSLTERIGVASPSNGLKYSMMIVPYTQTAYATYETAAILSAASSVAQYTSSASALAMANQAAAVLEGNLWSGTGCIAGGSPHTSWLWSFTGGEQSAYLPNGLAWTGYGGDTYSYCYYSNQGGVFGEVSHILQNLGYGGVQPAESPGSEPSATESTGLSAAALMNFIAADFTPFGSRANQYIPPTTQSVVTPITMSPTSDFQMVCYGICNDSSSNGLLTFTNTNGSEVHAFDSQSFVLTKPVNMGTLLGELSFNGTVSTGANMSFYTRVVNPTSGATLAEANYTLTAGNYTYGYIQVSDPLPYGA